jgi:methanethiol oxidase
MAGEAAVEVVANGASGACCHAAKGPGYATPLEAMEKGPREKLIYVTCIYNGAWLLPLPLY